MGLTLDGPEAHSAMDHALRPTMLRTMGPQCYGAWDHNDMGRGTTMLWEWGTLDGPEAPQCYGPCSETHDATDHGTTMLWGMGQTLDGPEESLHRELLAKPC